MIDGEAYRPLDAWETRVLDKLLTPNFPGRNELRAQIEFAECRTIDENGSLALRTTSGRPAMLERRVPIQADAADSDGVAIHFLLHAPGGTINELEIYKDDSSPVIHRPEPDDLEILLLY